MIKRLIVSLTILSLLLTPTLKVRAQSSDLPTYTIQSGDTINTIAIRFGVSAQDIIDTNQLSDPNILVVGTNLKIPGLSGVSGNLTTEVAPIGSSLLSLSRQYQVSKDLIIQLNQLTSPSLVYVGSTIILPESDQTQQLYADSQVTAGEATIEYAAANNANPWTTALLNQKQSPSALLPQEPLYGLKEENAGSTTSIPNVQSIEITPLPLVQGRTEVIRVLTTQPMELTGTLAGYPLHFVQEAENQYVALQGIYALAETGLTSVSLSAQGEDGHEYHFEQSVILESGYYPQESITVDPATIDPAVTKPEDEVIKNIISNFTEEKYWSGKFVIPVDEPSCIFSWFGTRRSYNGSDYTYFHSGVDYGVCASLNIYAPAAGKVVFAQETTVRGLATIIDHGNGIYSGIWHQSAFHVQVGDVVQAGQLIGEIGGTGRVTGPHLHWEVWVNGVQVDPLDWLENEYP